MPRPISSDLADIFPAYKRRDTLDIYLADGNALHLSRGRVIRNIAGDDVEYSNWIRAVGDMTASIDKAVDRISITCQNVSSELGFNLASALRVLDYATVDYGKVYESLRSKGLAEDIPQMFRGVMANAEADEEVMIFEVIVDYESLGSIIASRGMGPLCGWTYKNGIECTSVSAEPTCVLTRKSCSRRGVEHQHGGWEEYEQPVSAPPSGGGNDGGGIGTGTCFTLDTPVWTPAGEIPIGELKPGDAIVSFDEQTGEIHAADEVVETFDHEASGFFTFEFEHGPLNVTPEHRLFRGAGEFVIADAFKLGDSVKAHTSNWIDSRLKRIRWNSDGPITVRNLHVRRNHTYFANRCGVHNAKPLEPLN